MIQLLVSHNNDYFIPFYVIRVNQLNYSEIKYIKFLRFIGRNR